jgi:hypothetical protein
MTQLANANLLDESVANSSSLKTKRLNRTAQTAINPNQNPIANNPMPKQNYQSQNPNPNQNPMPKVSVLKKVEDLEEEEDNDYNDDDYETDNERQDNYQKFQNEFVPNKTENKENSDKKILGMKPVLFWALVGVGAAVGAYFGYKYIKKRKLGALGSSLSSNTVPNNTVAAGVTGGAVASVPTTPEIKI